jgi:hypothetical protein
MENENGETGTLLEVEDDSSNTQNATGLSSRTAFVQGDRSYSVSFMVEAVWGVRQSAVASFFLRPSIVEWGQDGVVDADLSRATLGDLVRLDLIILGEAQRLLHLHLPATPCILHVPINQASLGSLKGRPSILSALDALQPFASMSLVIILEGLGTGTPNSRIRELTSVLKARTRAVIAMASGFDTDCERWTGANLSGVGIDFGAQARPSGESSEARFSTFARRGQTIAPVLIGYGAPDTAYVLAAWAAGFTHISVNSVYDGRASRLLPVRFEPMDLYRPRRRS